MLKRFVKDERGNFAIFTGLIATVLIGALGGTLDLSTQWAEQTAVQRAVDAAALAGAKELEAGSEFDAHMAIQSVGQANLPEGFPTVAFIPTIDQTKGIVTVEGVGQSKPVFLPLFKIDQLPIGATAEALIQRKSYIDFYFLLDVSESMNIAASDEDRRKLEAYTASKNTAACAFACHLRNDSVNPPRSWFEMSREAGVRLRIDVLRDASKGMIDKILDLNDEPGSLKSTRISTAGFSSTLEIGTPPITDRTILKDSIDKFSNANHHTNIRAVLRQWKTDQLTPQGRGTGPADVKKFAILVTDGVRDDNSGFHWTGLGPIEPSLCEAIKDMGVELAVLEIKYIEDRDERFFRERVSWYYNQISPNLKTCASPGLYAQAQDAGEAETKLLKLVDTILTIRRRLSS